MLPQVVFASPRSCFILYPARSDKLVVYNSVGSNSQHFEAEQSTREGLPAVMEGDFAV